MLTCLTASADYQDGLDAYTFGDYATAMAEWQAVVSSPPGDVNPAIFAEAHYAIAKLYWQGDGVDQDFRAAYQWLVKAAELDHAGAQAKLGFMYTDGLTVQQDFSQAFEWYSKAARGGNVDGLYNLGIFYYYGWGVTRDLPMAAQYLAAASALGDAPSEEALQQVLSQIEAEKAPPIGGHAQRQSGAASLAEPKPQHPHSLRSAAESLNVDFNPDLAQYEPRTSVATADTNTPPADVGPNLVREESQKNNEDPDRSDADETTNPSRTMSAPTEDQSAVAATGEDAVGPNVVRDQSTTTSAPVAEPPAADPVWRDEAWIAAQDPDHYTIQVMALSDLDLLRKQAEGFERLAPFAIYTVQKSTSPLHVLVQGSYPNVEAARAAQKAFPRKIQKADKLWIRRFEMVQRLLE